MGGQLIILAIAALVLVGAIARVYDMGGDAREADIRESITRQKEEIRKDKEAHEKTMRDFATGITKNFLAFQGKQTQYYSGVKDAINEAAKKDPTLNVICFGPDGVRRFNDVGTGRPEGGEVPAKPNVDAVVPGKRAPYPKRVTP